MLLIDFQLTWNGFLETVLMTLCSVALAYLVGLPLGIILNITSKNGIARNRIVNIILGVFINIIRSIPCLLLIIVLIPLTRSIFGIGTGEWYVLIIPLFVSSFAFVSRIVETSLNEVNTGVVEVAKSLGANNFQIITKVLLKEATPSLVSGLAVTTISIIGYTAFAYDFGAGGLIAQAYEFYTSNTVDFLSKPDIYIIILVIVVLVQIIQEVTLLIVKKIDKRRKIK